MASPECPGVNLDPVSLIKLLAIFGNSKDLEKDFNRLANETFKEENIEDIIKEVTLDLREYLNMKSDLFVSIDGKRKKKMFRSEIILI